MGCLPVCTPCNVACIMCPSGAPSLDVMKEVTSMLVAKVHKRCNCWRTYRLLETCKVLCRSQVMWVPALHPAQVYIDKVTCMLHHAATMSLKPPLPLFC